MGISIKTKHIHLVPKELLLEYLTTINRMIVMRELSVVRYGELDRQRQTLHNQILTAANVSRDDKEFAYELALFCEGMIK